ncbi:MAG: NAD(P)H-hydrate epimerase, partial [Candidatus Limnocylindria bacterium]
MASSGAHEDPGFPVLLASTIPAVTAEQMREVDRIMVEDLHIELIQMMENAGRNLASLAIRRFAPRAVTVLAGPGGNGGGGLAAARHLTNHAVDVSVVLSSSDRMGEVPRHQLDIVERMGIAVTEEPPATALVIDAILGYSLHGDPAGRAAELIRWCLHQTAPVCSLDTPSGLDVTTGEPRTPCVRATATLTLALPKVGLARASSYVGELYLADISVPPFVYGRLGPG